MKNKFNQQFVEQLSKIYDKDEAKAIADLVFKTLFSISFASTNKHQEKFSQLQHILYRLSNKEPLQYILEESFFMNCKLKVNKNVLIPRPETEELVHGFIAKHKNLTNANFNIIDVCGGSGCIAIAIAKNFKNASVYCLEKSEQAIAVAKENATINNVVIKFIQQDFFDFTTSIKFDFIISNPPYVTELERNSIDKNVLDFEPHQALFVSNEKPLVFYEHLKSLADKNLKSNGEIQMEVNGGLAEEVKNLFGENYSSVIKQDMFGKSRFVIATKN